MNKAALSWLPEQKDWTQQFRAAKAGPAPLPEWVALANAPLDFIKTDMLNTAYRKAFPAPPPGLSAPPIRLAVLGSSTTKHLHPALRVAGLRRGFHVDIYEPDYGQYWFELMDPGSPLHEFAPTAVLFAFDARHMTRGLSPLADAAGAAAARDETIGHVQACWEKARAAFDATILQQTVLPAFPELVGQNEQILPGSPAAANRAAERRLARRRLAGRHPSGGDRQPGRRGTASTPGTATPSGIRPSRKSRSARRRFTATW